jgi:ribonuclease HI
MAKKQKYYVVWQGAKPGVYTSWEDCKAQINGYPGARYMSFESAEEATRAYKNGPNSVAKKSEGAAARPSTGSSRIKSPFIRESLSVDAATSGNPGPTEYQGVRTDTREQIFHKAFPLGTNNIGEFLAIVHGLALCKREGWTIPIYSDSKTAIGWVKKKKCNTNLEETSKTAELFDLVRRAEKWLAENTYNTKILKWETEDWGEIPADFGRK